MSAISTGFLRVRIRRAVGVGAVVVVAVLVLVGNQDVVLCESEISKGVLSRGNGDFAGERLERVRCDCGMKDLQLISPGWDIFDVDFAMRIGDSVVRSRQCNDDGTHLRMDVAEDERNPRLVELNKARSAALVKTQIEALAFEKREHVVEERVIVGKFDFASDWNHDEAGVEFLVPLHECRNVRRILLNPLNLRADRIQPDDGL